MAVLISLFLWAVWLMWLSMLLSGCSTPRRIEARDCRELRKGLYDCEEIPSEPVELIMLRQKDFE